MTSAQGKSEEIKIDKLTSAEQDKSAVERERERQYQCECRSGTWMRSDRSTSTGDLINLDMENHVAM